MSTTSSSTGSLSGAAPPFIPRTADNYRDGFNVPRLREQRAYPPFLWAMPQIRRWQENHGLESSSFGRARRVSSVASISHPNVPLRVRNLQPCRPGSNWPCPGPLAEYMNAPKLETCVDLVHHSDRSSPACQREQLVYDSRIRKCFQDNSPPTPSESAANPPFINLNSNFLTPLPPGKTLQKYWDRGIMMSVQQPARMPATPSTPITPTGLIPPKGPKLWKPKINDFEPISRPAVDSGTFEEDFKRMRHGGRIEFLKYNYVNINVQLPSDYSKKICALEIEENTRSDESDKENISEDDTKLKSKEKGKGKEFVTSSKEVTKFAENTGNENDINLTNDAITQINSMVRNTVINDNRAPFTQLARRLIISLHFPANPNITPLNSSISIAPISGPSTSSPYFASLENLVEHINHTFVHLRELIILLRVPSNSRMPFTVPQLYHVLPFYDLRFTKWGIMYRPSNLSMEIEVQGWSVQRLDRERAKYIERRMFEAQEEERVLLEERIQALRIANAVVVRPSAGLGDVDLSSGCAGTSGYMSVSGSGKQGMSMGGGYAKNGGESDEGSFTPGSGSGRGSSGHASPTPSTSTNGSSKPLLR